MRHGYLMCETAPTKQELDQRIRKTIVDQIERRRIHENSARKEQAINEHQCKGL